MSGACFEGEIGTRRILKGIWTLLREAPTGLPTVVLGLSLLALAAAAGSDSAAAFLWPVVCAWGVGLMLAIEYRASAAGTACAAGALLAILNQYFLFAVLSPPVTEYGILSLAVTAGLLSAGPAWLMMLVSRGRQQGGDGYAFWFLPVTFAMILWTLVNHLA